MTEKDLHRKSIMDSLLSWSLIEREAASLLSLSLRQTQRIKKKIREGWDEAMIHKLRGRPSNHHHDPSKYDEALRIITSKYSDYSYVMMQEKLEEKYDIILSMPTLRNELIRRGIRKIRRQKVVDIHRTMRERKACFWEMIQYDWSYHLWFENRAPEACLLVSVDDATEEIHARFDDSEWLWPTYRFWREYMTSPNHGKPKAIYLDRFSTYKINHPNATDDHELTTQFGRVCKELWIELIFAHSPQGKGRVERMNQTLQDRLVKELRENNISTIAEANRFLDQVFLPNFNTKFRVEPRSPSNMHTHHREDEVQSERLDAIFSEQKIRKVHNDFTIRFEGKILQLYRNKQWWSIVHTWDQVRILRFMDGSIHVFNMNQHDVLFQELGELPVQSSSLSLPPVIWEDVSLLKIRQQDRDREEKILRQSREKQIRDDERQHLSLTRQVFHLKHGRHTPFAAST